MDTKLLFDFESHVVLMTFYFKIHFIYNNMYKTYFSFYIYHLSDIDFQ